MKKLRVLITGATGFVGQHLIEFWREKHDVAVLGRTIEKLRGQYPTLNHLTWDQLDSVNPNDFDVVINLSGETINHLFWTKKIKQKILSSRVQSTGIIVNWLCKNPNPNLHFLSTSALSIYGLYSEKTNEVNTENTPISEHPEFLSQVAHTWENALKPLEHISMLTTVMRFAVVLDAKQGALAKLILPAKLGLAARLGNGQQPFAWIAIDDLIAAIDWVVTQKMAGPVNMLGPSVPTQDEFSQELARALHRPYFLRIPAIFLKTFLGQMAKEILLKGQQASPEVLLKSGFKFNFKDVAEYLKN